MIKMQKKEEDDVDGEDVEKKKMKKKTRNIVGAERGKE